ncbi:hypothetical protein RHGRI_027620 [Rhododendron griersonianum]|uniref:Uncharacterized protein n=1 Tax=Rhododendron griersonianum TaxID=479676 RepID=A0AAV6IXH6_9ERIC|nr:hypothetical protein RHGRI_027620 [Rhododendron griersonianum]
MLIFVVQGIMSKRISQTQCSASESSSSENEQSGSESSSSETEQSGSESSSSLDDSPYNIPDPPATWYPLGSLPATRPDHSSASNASTSSQSTQRQTRGPTWMHGDWNPGGGMLHIVPNELNQTVEGHTPLASHLGVLARDGSLLPLTYKSWHYVPKENKERIWREIKETNRNKGVPTSRLQVWKAAYLKEGSVASDAVNEVMTQMTELSTQMEGSSTESTCIDEDIFVKVMGPEQPGRVRTFGLGPSIKDVFGGGYRRSQEQTHIFQAQMQEQFQLYRVQFETQMKEMMEMQMAAMRTQMDATIQAQAATIQAQQTRMEHLESQLVTRGGGGPVAREAAWGHHPMSRPKQNSHEFTSSSSHQKVSDIPFKQINNLRVKLHACIT